MKTHELTKQGNQILLGDVIVCSMNQVHEVGNPMRIDKEVKDYIQKDFLKVYEYKAMLKDLADYMKGNEMMKEQTNEIYKLLEK